MILASQVDALDEENTGNIVVMQDVSSISQYSVHSNKTRTMLSMIFIYHYVFVVFFF